MAQPLAPQLAGPLPHAQDPAAAPSPRPSVVPGLSAGSPLTLDQVVEEQRLARLAIEVLRQLLAQGTPRPNVLARYLELTEDDLARCAECRQRLSVTSRRSLARVALAFAPQGLRHTARRLFEGEMARAAGRGDR